MNIIYSLKISNIEKKILSISFLRNFKIKNLIKKRREFLNEVVIPKIIKRRNNMQISNNCCCIVPGHVFKHIAENHHDEKTRNNALEHLIHIGIVRANRHVPHSHEVDVGEAKERTSHTAQIVIYNANHQNQLPGHEWENKGFHHWDDSAKNAYKGLKATYDFFSFTLHRNSIDDQGMQLDASVHYKKNYCNAFWTGSSEESKGQMAFGDGDGKIFNSFTVDIDVTAHELSHGVTEYFAGSASGHATGLNYTDDEAGGLNEAASDWGGSVVKQFVENQKATNADWLIGEHLFKSKDRNVRALRDMLNPGTAYDNPKIGKDLQVKDVAALEQFKAENKNVVDPHIGSGIPNRAFAVAAIDLEEESWLRAYPVLYHTLPELSPDATYLQCAQKSITVARKMFHDDPKVEGAFIKAWTTVGVLK